MPKEALVHYTQVSFDHIVSEYDRLLQGPLKPIVEALTRRLDEMEPAMGIAQHAA